MNLEKIYLFLVSKSVSAQMTANEVIIPLEEFSSACVQVLNFNKDVKMYLSPQFPNKVLFRISPFEGKISGNLGFLLSCGFCDKAIMTLGKLSQYDGLVFELSLRKKTPAPVFTVNGKTLIGEKNINVYKQFLEINGVPKN